MIKSALHIKLNTKLPVPCNLFTNLNLQQLHAYVTATIFIHIILHSAVHIYDFHIFVTLSSSFHGFITNQFNGLLPVGLLA